MQFITVPVATCLFLLVTLSCYADEPSSTDGRALLGKGVAAFQAGDAALAYRYLSQARAHGLDGNALAYNLGVASYQLGRYDAAAREFHSLLETPHKALAQYNLGLIALAQGDSARAHTLFQALAADTGNDKIRDLALRQLERLADTGTGAERAGPSGLVLAGAGYDSNVDQLPDTATSGGGDAYADVLLSAEADFGEAPGKGGHWTWSGLGYHQRFPAADDANLSLLEGDTGWQASVAETDLELRPFTRHWWLDTERVESYYGARASARRDHCGPFDRCYVRVELATVAGGPEYPEYDGGQYDLEGGLQQSLWGGMFGVELGLERADRDDIREADYALSVSPLRQRLELSWRRNLGEAVTLTGRTAYRHSDYQGDYRWQTDSSTVTSKRRDERWSAALLADWQLTSDWFATSELLYESNQSTLDGYDYDRYNLWLGVGKTF